MLDIGSKIKGEIMDFTHEGNGVLKIDNIAIFVPNGIIGDIVEIKITEVKKNYALGSIVKLIEPSIDRVNNDNKGSSGEIPLVNYKYEKQLQWKKKKVEIDLIKFAGINNVKVFDTIGMNYPYRYRNHTQIPVGSRNGKAILGFYEKKSHNIIDMESSILQADIADKVLNCIRDWIEKNDIKPYDRRTNKGVLRHIGIRTNDDDQVMVILVTATDYLPSSLELVKGLLKNTEGIVSIYHNINKLPSAPTYGNKYKKIYGEDRLLDYLGDFKFNISPNSFFQVNRTQANVLYTMAIEYLDLQPTDIVFDIYSGIGTISLFISKKANMVYGIEIIKDAVIDATENATLNGIHNVKFKAGKAEEVLFRLIEEGIKGNKVVIDPPRKGCEKEVLEAIVGLNPEKVVYVSCNSTTMARDVKYLIDNGYKVEEVQPVDMFPHTPHVETVVSLSHKNADSHIHVNIEFGEGDGKIPVDKIAQKAEDYRPGERVTYKMIQECIEGKYDFKVHTAYIAEVKRDLGLPMYDAPNAVEELKHERKHPTPEKVEAIKDALKHFKVI